MSNKNTKKHLKLNSNQKKTKKKKYHLRNWPEYNESLKQRGALDVWVEKSVLDNWYAKPTHKRGAQPIYSDLAIQLSLQLGKVFNQRLRQTERLVNSLLRLMKVDCDVPNYSTFSRRSDKLTKKIKLPKTTKKENEKITIVIDSSGLKVFGEGEWKVRKHGYSKHRTWRKVHLAITPDGEFRAVALTPNSTIDSHAAVNLLNQEKSKIKAIIGDGAYDKRNVAKVCREKEVDQIIIPPQKNARIWQHGNTNAPPHPRDENLRAVRKSSIQAWERDTGYHIRSLAETAIFRFKTIFGDKLHARKTNQQITEALITVCALNKMFQLGMPDSYSVNA